MKRSGRGLPLETGGFNSFRGKELLFSPIDVGRFENSHLLTCLYFWFFIGPPTGGY